MKHPISEIGISRVRNQKDRVVHLQIQVFGGIFLIGIIRSAGILDGYNKWDLTNRDRETHTQFPCGEASPYNTSIDRFSCHGTGIPGFQDRITIF
jgi:hypothetical protein